MPYVVEAGMPRRFVRNSSLGALAGASITLGNFISAVMAARILGAEGIGAVSYALWLALSIAPVVECGAASAVSRYVPEMRGRGQEVAAEHLAAYLARVLVCSTLISVAAIVVVDLEVNGWIGSASGAERVVRTLFGSIFYALPGLLACYVVLQVLSAFGYSYLRGKQQFDRVAWLAVLSAALQIVCVTGGSLYFGAAGAVGGYLAGLIVPAITASKVLIGGTKVEPDLAKRVRRYSAYAWAANIANAFVWARIEIFFLAYFWGDSTVGMFAVALALTNLATQPPLLMTSGVLSLLSEKSGRRDTDGIETAYSSGTTLLAALVLPASFGMAAIMPALLPLLYGNDFSAAIPAASIMVCAAGISVANIMATNLVYALERSDFVFYTSLLGALFAILCGLLLVPTFGLMGGAMARATIQLLMVAIGSWFVWHRLGYRLSIPSLARVLAASLISAAVAALAVRIMPAPVCLLIAIPAGVLTYLLALAVLRALPARDVKILADAVRTFLPLFSGLRIRFASLFHEAGQQARSSLWRNRK
jgi:O-antigen/teichoic acid export membrane protein